MMNDDGINAYEGNFRKEEAVIKSSPRVVKESESEPVKRTVWEVPPKVRKRKNNSEYTKALELDRDSLQSYEAVDHSIQNIPTLEKNEDDELIKQVAEAPEDKQTDIQTLDELDEKTFNIEAIYRNKDDIDLSILSNHIIDRKQCMNDNDVEWDEKVFINILSKESVKK